jgi:hypothetical protein
MSNEAGVTQRSEEPIPRQLISNGKIHEDDA